MDEIVLTWHNKRSKWTRSLEQTVNWNTFCEKIYSKQYATLIMPFGFQGYISTRRNPVMHVMRLQPEPSSVQITTCSPSCHSLSQCRVFVVCTRRDQLQLSKTRNAFENVYKMAAILSRPQCVFNDWTLPSFTFPHTVSCWGVVPISAHNKGHID